MRRVVWCCVLAACGGASGKAEGELGGRCYPNSTCNATLACDNGICVVAIPDAGVDAPADGPPDARPIDAPPDAAMVCNVLAQTGCSTGEKCTWIIDSATPSPVGHIGCAPDGTQATDAACTRNPPGATGYDNCVNGSYCFGPDTGGAGICKAICDQAGGAPACDSAHACSTYDGLFGPSGQPVAAGVCDVRCDPLADNNFLGSQGDNRTGTTCGSAGSASGSGFLYAKGCYGYTDDGTFGGSKWTCTAQFNPSRVHRAACDTTVHLGDTTACSPSGSSGYINGCAAGYEPVFFDAEGSTQIDCVALCHPASCYNTGSGSSAGSSSCGSGSATNITGTAPGQCNTQRLQAVSFDQVDPTTSWSSATPTVNNGEQCFYSWVFEVTAAGMIHQSATSDTVGFCVDHSKYRYDPSGGANNTTVWPRCDQIGLGSGGYNVQAGMFDASSFGCIDSTTARAAGDVTFTGKARFVRPALRMPYHSAYGAYLHDTSVVVPSGAGAARSTLIE